MTTDFLFTYHGSLFTLCPVSRDAKAWVEDHIPDDAPTFGSSIVIEPRYFQPILDGIHEAGLTT